MSAIIKLQDSTIMIMKGRNGIILIIKVMETSLLGEQGIRV